MSKILQLCACMYRKETFFLILNQNAVFTRRAFEVYAIFLNYCFVHNFMYWLFCCLRFCLSFSSIFVHCTLQLKRSQSVCSQYSLSLPILYHPCMSVLLFHVVPCKFSVVLDRVFNTWFVSLCSVTALYHQICKLIRFDIWMSCPP